MSEVISMLLGSTYTKHWQDDYLPSLHLNQLGLTADWTRRRRQFWTRRSCGPCSGSQALAS